jgi:cytosine/adenosine deaminase-related metal-dependent hydrolase
VFDAATLGGARALGRADLGRLAPGARADLLVVSLQSMQYGAVRDPIKSLVECGSASDIDTVVIDGRTLVEGGRALAMDEATLLRQIQEAGERSWEEAPTWHWAGASVDEIAPMSYPIRAAEQS